MALSFPLTSTIISSSFGCRINSALLVPLNRSCFAGSGLTIPLCVGLLGKSNKPPQGYEDLRKILVGDSFSCYSFVFVAAQLCGRWIDIPPYSLLANRMGMAPGFSCPVEIEIPLRRNLAYNNKGDIVPVEALYSVLLRRVDHTGSDVRISTGTLMNPRAYPRQSAAAAQWKWSKVFACKWSRTDYIKSLELRSIIYAIAWRVKHLKEGHIWVFHLTDSYVAMCVCFKAASSSKMLKPLLSRFQAFNFANSLRSVPDFVSHVR